MFWRLWTLGDSGCNCNVELRTIELLKFHVENCYQHLPTVGPIELWRLSVILLLLSECSALLLLYYLPLAGWSSTFSGEDEQRNADGSNLSCKARQPSAGIPYICVCCFKSTDDSYVGLYIVLPVWRCETVLFSGGASRFMGGVGLFRVSRWWWVTLMHVRLCIWMWHMWVLRGCVRVPPSWAFPYGAHFSVIGGCNTCERYTWSNLVN